VLLVVATLALAVLPIATAASPLRWRGHTKYQSYRVLLPPSWRFRDASYPSDHATFLWYDPTNPLRKLLVVVSGCVGCVSTNLDGRHPYPQGELPDEATNTYRISPWKLAFSGYTTDDPYPENGLVVVLAHGGRIVGSAIARLWLPQREHGLATRILNSFSPR
jgi:hypothetical protein